MDHFYQSLPGWCDFADLYAERVRTAVDGAHFVEVGTYAGKSAACMGVEIINSGKQIRFDTCDTFMGIDKAVFHNIDDYLAQEARRDEDGLLLDYARAQLAGLHHYVNVRVGESLSLVDTYADASLDFVFLDDDHSTAHVLKELVAWWPKVTPGGYLAGHDLNWESVRSALEPWAQMSGLTLKAVSATSWSVQKPQPVTLPVIKQGQRRCLVAVCSNERNVYRQTAMSLMQMGWGQRVTKAATRHGFDDVRFAWITQFTLVSDLRNGAVRIAQAQQCSHILFLDADMLFPADLLEQMLAHHDKGIVSGLYFLKTWPHWPVAFTRPRVNPESLAVDYDYDKTVNDQDGLVPEAMIGMGCALIPMAVFEAMPAPWFEYREDPNGNFTVTEDVSFCQKARALGVPISVAPSIECGHVGQPVIASPWYQRSLIEMSRIAELQGETVLA